jgi:hypothetical protein
MRYNDDCNPQAFGWLRSCSTNMDGTARTTPSTRTVTAPGLNGVDIPPIFTLDGFSRQNRVRSKTVPVSTSGAAGYSVWYGYDVRGLQTFARFGSITGTGVTNQYDAFGWLRVNRR